MHKVQMMIDNVKSLVGNGVQTLDDKKMKAIAEILEQIAKWEVQAANVKSKKGRGRKDVVKEDADFRPKIWKDSSDIDESKFSEINWSDWHTPRQCGNDMERATNYDSALNSPNIDSALKWMDEISSFKNFDENQNNSLEISYFRINESASWNKICTNFYKLGNNNSDNIFDKEINNICVNQNWLEDCYLSQSKIKINEDELFLSFNRQSEDFQDEMVVSTL